MTVTDCVYKAGKQNSNGGIVDVITSCLIFSFLVATIAHLISSSVNSSWNRYFWEVKSMELKVTDAHLEFLYRVGVHNDPNISVLWCPCFLENRGNLQTSLSVRTKSLCIARHLRLPDVFVPADLWQSELKAHCCLSPAYSWWSVCWWASQHWLSLWYGAHPESRS